MTAAARVGLSLIVGAACAFCGDLAGTWKLNQSRSNMRPPQFLSEVVVISRKDLNTWRYDYTFQYKDGRKTHSEGDYRFDGEQRPVEGSMGLMEIALPPENSNWTRLRTKDGKLTVMWRSEISADNQTQTVHRTTVNDQGEVTTENIVFERQ
jgi:hypothetical protein